VPNFKYKVEISLKYTDIGSEVLENPKPVIYNILILSNESNFEVKEFELTFGEKMHNFIFESRIKPDCIIPNLNNMSYTEDYLFEGHYQFLI
jgi:hypothetical protein